MAPKYSSAPFPGSRSALAEVFGYLDDPANADVFVEVARLQRVEQ